MQDSSAAVLGNSSGVSAVSDICFHVNCGGNVYGLNDNINDVITFLRNESIFDGTFNYYGIGNTPTQVPEVTLGMSWANIKNITETTYPFVPSGGDGAVHLGSWAVGWIYCQCSDYVAQPICMTTTDPLASITFGLYPDESVCWDNCPPQNWVNPLNQIVSQGYGDYFGVGGSGQGYDPADDDGGGGGGGGYNP